MEADLTPAFNRNGNPFKLNNHEEVQDIYSKRGKNYYQDIETGNTDIHKYNFDNNKEDLFITNANAVKKYYIDKKDPFTEEEEKREDTEK